MTVARREVTSYCRICAAACGIIVTVEGRADDHAPEQVVQVRGDPDHPVSRGYTCPKGRALPDWHHGPGRLDVPHVRGEPVGWDAALDDLATAVRDATEAGGPDAFGAYLATGLAYDVAGWMTAERLLRRTGTRQRYTPVTVDNAPVLRAAELVTGTAQLNPVWDPSHSRLLLLFGTNPVVSHGYGTTLADPITRIRDFRGAGGELWVLDPRRTETATLADRYLPVRPGSDVEILAWLVRELLVDGADRHELDEHCHASDVDRLVAALAPFGLDRAAHAAGIDATELGALLDAVRRAGRVAVMCGTGVTMSRDGVLVEWLRWALLIVTGSVDRAGGMRCNRGWLAPLDGRRWPADPPEAGSIEPGPSTRPDLARWLGQYPCTALADEIEHGPLRVLVVAGGNPLTAFPDPERTRAALARLDALVVLDVAENELTAMATHVLPVTGQLERADVSMLENVSFADGTQWTPAVVAPGASRRPAWWALAQLARRLGLDVLGGTDPDVSDDDTVLGQIAAGSRGGYDDLAAAGPHGVSMPGAYGWVHDRVLPEGRWRLAPAPFVDRLARRTPPTESPPLVLVPRRRVRSMNSARYVANGDQARDPADVLVHPGDAAALGIGDGDIVRVESAHGALEGVARLDPRLGAGVVSCTHGASVANVARLTSARMDLDSETGMPRASGVPVTLRRAGGGGA